MHQAIPLLLVLALVPNVAQDHAPAAPDHKMKMHAHGTFEVSLNPLKDDHAAKAGIGRNTIDKQFRGDLEARSVGQMMAVGTAVQGSAAYVALERVEGKLQGRTGSFILQHVGLMNRGTPTLTVTVVPDSGTGELTGLTGTLVIHITEAGHAYDFDYELPAK